jgi:hypothetical protein
LNQTILDERHGIVRYNLLENPSYKSGVRLYDISYTKISPNLIRHELRDPISNVYVTFNNLKVNISIDTFNQKCATSNLSDEQIYSAVIDILKNGLFIDTDQTGYPSYTLGDSAFQPNGITDIGNGLYKVLFTFEDGNNNDNTDGILEVIVEKCYITDTNYTTIGQMEVFVDMSACAFETEFSNSSSSLVAEKVIVGGAGGNIVLVDVFGNYIGYT